MNTYNLTNKTVEKEHLLIKRRKEIAETVSCKECDPKLCHNDYLRCIKIKENQTITKWFKKFNMKV